MPQRYTAHADTLSRPLFSSNTKDLAMIRRLLISVSMFALPFTAAAAETDSKAFEARDLFGLQAASSPEISPDGRRVAYVRTHFDLATDQPQRSIWLVDVANGATRPVGSGGGQSGPRWSPDGTRLAYVAPDSQGHAQIHVYWLDTGVTRAITSLVEGPGDLTWSPDGKQIYFTSLVPDAAPSFGNAPEKPEGATWAPPLRVITDAYYTQDGGGFVRPGHSHLFAVPADGGTPRQLTDGSFDERGPVTLAPDGQSLVFVSARKLGHELAFGDTDLFQLEIPTGKVTQLTDRIGPDEEPVISPDGRMLVWTGYDERNHGYDNYQLYVMPTSGGTPHLLTGNLDRSTEQPHWSPDGRSILVTSTDHGVTRILRVTLDGRVSNVARNLTSTQMDRPYSQDGPYPESRFSVSRTGVVATTFGDTTAPPDVAIAEKSGKSRTLTSLNPQLGQSIQLAQVKTLAVRSSYDGLPIDAWLMTPANFDPTRKYPLILEIHGGPAASYGPNFGAQLQLYAAAGYIVLYANPRGSSSYGMDFALLGDKKFPGHDYEDLMSAVDAAIGTGYVDADNLFVTGGSGGGSLTAWIVGKTDRFKAAVTQKPAISWMSLLLTTDAYTIYWNLFAEKYPWQDSESLWRRSPLSLVDNVKTPTMVLVGDQDYRTPMSESQQYYGALKLHGSPTALVLVPGAGHDSLAARPSQLGSITATILGWFDKYRSSAK
jgi:dipeptidyl aminopeptidase/acylaminoacyl peptidase